jgi:phosphohistidine phosphatase SixA
MAFSIDCMATYGPAIGLPGHSWGRNGAGGARAVPTPPQGGFAGGAGWCRNCAEMIYLLRHAHAGSKKNWEGPDDRRPLSATGRREAAGLVVRLAALPVGTVLSSPALRCLQTVGPLAEQRGLPVALDGRLHVDAQVEETAALLLSPDLGDTVLCTHGELIGELLGRLREGGAPITEDAEWPKGSTWVLLPDGGRVAEATYLPPLRAAEGSA